MSMRRSLIAAVSSGALVFGGLAVTAFADPAGCGGSGDISVNGAGLMTATAEAGCSVRQTRTLRVEIKHDLSFQPDSLVAANTQTATTQSYYVQVKSCDSGKTATYYGRGFFATNTTYHDSAHHKWHVC
jgi:hypothetical protein